MIMKKKTVIMLSGTGSNAEALLEYSLRPDCGFEVSALFTDRPDRCRAIEIGKKFNKEVLQLDIFEYYRNHGEKGIGLINERRSQLRDRWTCEVEKVIDNAGYRPDFLMLAGFEPLSNITRDFVTLNVHPGDLTVERNGKRYSHSIDPNTGFPAANNMLSATIICDDTSWADCLASICMLVGMEKAQEILATQVGVKAFFIYEEEGEVRIMDYER